MNTPPKVGTLINGWVVTRIWEWDSWWDLDLIDRSSGEFAYLRIIKNI